MVTPQDSADTPRFSVFHRETSELVKNVATFLQILLPLTSVSRDDQETNKTLGELKQREGGGCTLRAVIPEKAHTHAHHQSAHTLNTAGLQTRSALHCLETCPPPTFQLHYTF